MSEERFFPSMRVCSDSATPYTDATKATKAASVPHIKRPMNAFMVWSQIQRAQMISRNPRLHNAVISQTLGARWRKLSEKERRPYRQEAERLRLLHIAEFPHYKYKPRRRVKSGKKSKEAVEDDPAKDITSTAAVQNKHDPAEDDLSSRRDSVQSDEYPVSQDDGLEPGAPGKPGRSSDGWSPGWSTLEDRNLEEDGANLGTDWSRDEGYIPPCTELQFEVDMEETDFSLFSSDPLPGVESRWFSGKLIQPVPEEQRTEINEEPVEGSSKPVLVGGSGAGTIYSWNLPSLDNDDIYYNPDSFHEEEWGELPATTAGSCPPVLMSCPSCHCNLSCRADPTDPTGTLSLPAGQPLRNFAETSLNIDHLL